MKKYGLTPWGERFIESVERVMDKGRLSRGKSYANTGKVFSLDVVGTQIDARVRGHYRSSYKTRISFKAFSEKEKQLIYTVINENPLILASILSGRLPVELDTLLREKGVFLFPQKWDDMKRSCSCPDWGDPCKHMAAVYFTFTSAIDKNPFLVFKIRGMDLTEYFHIEKESLDLHFPFSLETYKDTKINNKTPKIYSFSDYAPFIVSMLSENPPFCDLNYKDVMAEFYKYSKRHFAKHVYPYNNEDMEKIETIFNEADIRFYAKETIRESVFVIKNEIFASDPSLYDLFSEFDYKKKKNAVELGVLDTARLFISFKDEKGGAEYSLLYVLFRVAYILLSNSAFIPAVLPLENEFSIVYQPLVSAPEIKSQIEELKKAVPPFVLYNKELLDGESSLRFILSAFFTEYVGALSFMHTRRKNNPPDISRAFFSGASLPTKSIVEAELPRSVNNWFSVFNLTQSPYTYTIYIESHASYTLSVKVREGEEELFLKEALEKSDKISVLRFLSLITLYVPVVKELLSREHVEISREALEYFIFNTVFTLSHLGVKIVLPKELRNILKPRPVLTAKSSPAAKKTYLSVESLLNYQWKIAIGDKVISVEEFEELVKRGHRLIEFHNNFVEMTPEDAKRIFADLQRNQRVTNFDIIKANLQGDLYADTNTRDFLNGLFETKDVPVPSLLNAKLRPYQKRGYMWSVNNLLNGFGVLLADDMGLGKTIQAIAVILQMKASGHFSDKVLIVAPTTLLYNWEKEFEKFAPSLSVARYHGVKREIKETDVIITTYNLVMRDAEVFKSYKFSAIIIDEAQYIKNPHTKTTKAVKSFKAKYKIALSGTPVENKLSELWSIFDFVLPKYLKTLKEFTKEFATDIEIRRDKKKLEKLRKITSPFMLRRLKTDKSIISDLPEKTVIDQFASLSKEQAALYQGVVDENLKKIEMSEGIDRKGLIFKLLISLKQICNHPRNFDKKSAPLSALSGKTELLLTLLKSILEEDEKALIFTQYTEMAEILIDIIEKELLTTPLYLHGGLSTQKRTEYIDAFQNNPKHKIFILSLKAGGTGLNLTAASHVIHYDLWYNPAVENQATDRAFRIGQNKKVFVHRFITKNTFEEKIDRMIKSKQELSDLSVNVGEKWLSEFGDDDLKELFE